jgi:hypothetical protein
MSGNYSTENQDAPGGMGDTTAACAAMTAQAHAASDARQADAARFIVENGHAVVDGHADVGSMG